MSRLEAAESYIKEEFPFLSPAEIRSITECMTTGTSAEE